MAQRSSTPNKPIAKKGQGQSQSTEDVQEEDAPEIIIQAKNALQGFIAIGIVSLLAVKLGYHVFKSFDYQLFDAFPYFKEIVRLSTLDLVARALAYSAGVDLAFMLFTPGPDEAIEPLMVGLASAILFSISNISGTANLELAKEIGLYVLILFFLFFMKALFISKNDKSIMSAILRKFKK